MSEMPQCASLCPWFVSFIILKYEITAQNLQNCSWERSPDGGFTVENQNVTGNSMNIKDHVYSVDQLHSTRACLCVCFNQTKMIWPKSSCILYFFYRRISKGVLRFRITHRQIHKRQYTLWLLLLAQHALYSWASPSSHPTSLLSIHNQWEKKFNGKRCGQTECCFDSVQTENHCSSPQTDHSPNPEAKHSQSNCFTYSCNHQKQARPSGNSNHPVSSSKVYSNQWHHQQQRQAYSHSQWNYFNKISFSQRCKVSQRQAHLHWISKSSVSICKVCFN